MSSPQQLSRNQADESSPLIYNYSQNNRRKSEECANSRYRLSLDVGTDHPEPNLSHHLGSMKMVFSNPDLNKYDETRDHLIGRKPSVCSVASSISQKVEPIACKVLNSSNSTLSSRTAGSKTSLDDWGYIYKHKFNQAFADNSKNTKGLHPELRAKKIASTYHDDSNVSFIDKVEGEVFYQGKKFIALK